MRWVLILPLLFLFTPSFAFFKSGDNIIIDSSENISGNVYLIASTVTVNGVVDGDAIIVANTINVDGLVTGDLLALANSASVTGNVIGDVRGAGMSFSVDGFVGGEVLAVAGNLLLNDGSNVTGNITAACNSGIFAGTVNSDVLAAGNTIVFTGDILGNVTLYDNNLTIDSNSVISGFLNYTSDNEAVISGVVDGFIQKNKPSNDRWVRDNDFMGMNWIFNWASVVLMILSMLISGYVLFRLSDQTIKEVIKVSDDNLGMLVRGLGFLVLVPIASVIALITLIAAPLGVVSLLLYGILIYVSCVFAAFLVGSRLLEWFKAPNHSLMFDLLIGVLVLAIISYVPIIGWVINLAILLISLGSVVTIIISRYHERRRKKLL